ncbi:putative Dihydropyrimidine dehydrogenase [Blattamonas nauphoetae]|uniref:dihydropyrimidine dehydrogenase (NADP(+)) n=1 Tax=Blattamonas nauphoetae TaxID=2049346 RepID=A0ABQ9XM77_9EUKA|nr:putative Dihydropyrimidine dehydrogenase [Blattamonas nauphoetae]
MATNPYAVFQYPASVRKPPVLRPTLYNTSDKCHTCRTHHPTQSSRNRDFRQVRTMLNYEEGIEEAKRCMYCVDAPCSIGCPTRLDVPEFTHAIAQGNFYAAAQIMYTDNPLAWTCGLLCPCDVNCGGSCNLANTARGAIHIDALQCLAAESLMHMRLPQIRDPSIVELPQHNVPIALIGSGPASLSCATFLARAGFKNITIYEKNGFPGGVPAWEIPEFRIPYYVTRFEVKMVEDLGVNIVYNKALGTDITIEGLQAAGNEAIFIGTGLPIPRKDQAFTEAYKCPNVFESKTFLQTFAKATKPGMSPEKVDMPKMHGSVVVFGAGDVASDCCQAAFRCGAQFVTLVTRRGLIDVRMNEEEAKAIEKDKVEKIPCTAPREIIIQDGKAVKAVCNVMKKVPGTENYIVDEGQERTISFDFCITAFGNIGDNADLFKPVVYTGWNDTGFDRNTMQTNIEGVYAGGSFVGNDTVVEAVNDGKVAAWNIQRYLAKKHEGKDLPLVPTSIPKFLTAIDSVDISVDIAGLHFPNPFGIAAGPSSENCAMIKRAFKAGFGFVICKTFQVDEDTLPNVSPHIVGSAKDGNYINIELNSERKYGYWLKELPGVKKEFPNNILLASIHCKGSTDDWVKIATEVAATGVDGLQLNISCPNLGEKSEESYADIIRKTCQAVKAAVKIPIFPKIGHFQGNVVDIARAAKEGGADGVSGINTINGIYESTMDGGINPQVGSTPDGKTATGGMSGNLIRPFALETTASVKLELPDFPYIAAGGAENARTAAEFVNLGASAIQFCSASMHKGFDLLIKELVPGMQFFLYSQSRSDLMGWPTQVDPALIKSRKRRSPFGDKALESIKQATEEAQTETIPREPVELNEWVHPGQSSADFVPPVQQPIATIASLSGRSLRHIVPFADLSAEPKVISKIDLDTCLGCGRCKVACFDAGYACIVFDNIDRIPKVTPMCHGCGLCAAVCPSGSIKIVPKPPKN